MVNMHNMDLAISKCQAKTFCYYKLKNIGLKVRTSAITAIAYSHMFLNMDHTHIN